MRIEQSTVQLNTEDIRFIQSKNEKIRIKAKKSIQRNESINLRHGLRDSNFIRREQSAMEQSFRIYLYNIDRYLQAIDELCIKYKLNFVIDLKNKLSHEQYKMFWNNISLFKLYDGCKLQQEYKYHPNHYILLEGNVAAYKQNKVKDQQRQSVQYFQYQQGVVLLSNTLQNHKYNPYTLKAKVTSLLLMFTDQFYQKYLKKIVTKQYDQVASILSHSLLFRGIAAVELKRYIPYCSFETYKYNQLVYQEGDLIKQIFLILDGEIQIGFEREEIKQPKQDIKNTISLSSANIYRLSHQNTDKKEIKIVKVCKKQLFGLQAYDVFKQNYYEHHVRVTSNVLRVLCIRLDVLYDLQMEYPNLEQNLSSYLKKINQMHFKLLEKCQKMSVSQPITKKKKKNRKKKKKPQISLEWWGLAEKLQGSKQYRLPSPPKLDSSNHPKRKQPLIFENRTNKIDYFKRKLFQQQLKNLQYQQQKQNDLLINTGGLIPRLQKVKIKMINTKPKVINIAQKIKKKLIEYAKNDEVFCDKLQLQ